MAIYVTGDLHGGFEIEELRAWHRANRSRLKAEDYVIVAGDFGLPSDGCFGEEEDVRWMESHLPHPLFVDGNHEYFDYWARRPVEEWKGGRVQRLTRRSPIRHLMRGEVFDLGGETVFSFGGATSVDKDWRVPGESWWPEELPSEEEIEHARATLAAHGWKVDYVVTHTCANRFLSQTLHPDPNWMNPQTDVLTDFLDELEDKLQFRHWYYGHFHKDRVIDDRHTVVFHKVLRAGKGR